MQNKEIEYYYNLNLPPRQIPEYPHGFKHYRYGSINYFKAYFEFFCKEAINSLLKIFM